MKRRQFEIIRNEYLRTKEDTLNTFHSKWQAIMDEYSMRSFNEVLEWVYDRLENPDILLDHDCSVGTLHILCRKLLSLISLKEPYFTVNSQNPRDEAIAWLLEAAMPRELQRLKWSRKMRLAALWAILTGSGCVKKGVSSVYFYDEPAYAGKFLKNDNSYARDMKEWPVAPFTEYVDPTVQEGEVTIEVIPTTNVFFNPGARHINQVTRWYVRYQRPLQDIYRDNRYSALRKYVKPLNYEDDRDDPYLRQLPENDQAHSQYGEVIECYDVASGMYCVFSEDVSDGPLRDWTPVGLGIHCPYSWFTPIEHMGTPYGVPYALLFINQARAINQMRAILKEKISRDGKAIYFYDSDVLSEIDANEINAMHDGEFKAIPGLSNLRDGDPNMVIKAVEFGRPTPEILQLMNMFSGDVQFMTGLDDPTRNTQSSRDVTASEVQIRQQQQTLTIEDYVAKNEEFQEDVAADVFTIMLRKWPQEKMVRVTGDNEYTYFWVNVEKQRVLRPFTLSVVAGSTQKLDKATRARQFLELSERLLGIAQFSAQEAQMEMQQMPTSGVNWQEMMRLLCDQVDPTIANRILNRRNPVDLLMRLMRNHGIMPQPWAMSPDIAQQIEQQLTGQRPQLTNGVPSQNVVPFTQANGVAQPSMQAPGGFAPQDNAAFGSGRQLSEQAGSTVL